MKRVRGVVMVVVGAALGLGGCGSDLKADDPQGYKACQFYERSEEHRGDVEQGFGSLLVAGEAASKAKTDDIRAAAEGVGKEGAPPIAYSVDRDALRSACADAGYEFEG